MNTTDLAAWRVSPGVGIIINALSVSCMINSKIFALIGICLICALLVGDVVRPYPDGPFTVTLGVDGRTIPLSASGGINFASYTTVSERYAGGVYTKSPGATRYSSITAMTDAPNAQLDTWFASPTMKDIVVRMKNGAGSTIEAWMFYRMRPSSRVVQLDGKVKYFFDIPGSFERDRSITMP